MNHTARLALVFAAPFILTLGIRISVVGGPPYTNEGIYIFESVYELAKDGTASRSEPGRAGSYHLAALPPSTPFYPKIASFIGRSSTTPYLGHRLFDGVVASVASGLFGLLLFRYFLYGPALTMALMWALQTNSPALVASGFDNPIPFANVMYFSSLVLLGSRVRYAPALAGVPIAMAIIVREAYAPALLVTLAFASVHHGAKGLVKHLLVTVGAGALFFLVRLSLGDFRGLLNYYGDYALLFRNLAESMSTESVRAIRIAGFRSTVLASKVQVLLFVVGLVPLVVNSRRWRGCTLLGLVMCLAPVPEVYSKLCLPYHWGQLYTGLAFLAATGLSWLFTLPFLDRRVALQAALCVLSLVLVARKYDQPYMSGWDLNRRFAATMIHGDWESPEVARSRYLAVADVLRRASKPGDTLLVSGSMLGLYPLTGLPPACPDIVDISTSELKEHRARHPEWFASLSRSHPTFIVETMRPGLPPDPLRIVWPDFDRHYRILQTFPFDAEVHYGEFPCRVWSRTDQGTAKKI